MAIGHASNMIDKGSWQTDPQPHLPKKYRYDYKVLLRIVFYYKNFKFLCEYLKDIQTKDCIWYIQPKTSEIKDKTIVFSDKIKSSIYWQKDIYNLTFKNKKLQQLFNDTFRESNIFYSDDLTGTDFKQVIDFTVRR